jgi:four helix bundle protein
VTPDELQKRAFRFAVRAVKFCRTLPDTWEARRLGGQLIDAVTSTAMNYRAARRGRSRAEFIAKLGTVVEEADESVGWLEFITELGMARGKEIEWLTGESRELRAIFGSSLRTSRDNRTNASRSTNTS